MSDPSALSTPHIQTSTTQSRGRTLFGIGSGNAMEWFDWGVYTIFTPFFASQFFHSGDPVSDVLVDLSTRASLRLVSQLPPEQAEAVRLRVMAGLDTDQVAEIMGKQPGNVRVLSHRGLRNLARRLTPAQVTEAVGL